MENMINYIVIRQACSLISLNKGEYTLESPENQAIFHIDQAIYYLNLMLKEFEYSFSSTDLEFAKSNLEMSRRIILYGISDH